MLNIRNISFSIEGRPLIVDASAAIPTGHKVGLVGRNGTGKTTLFKLIYGQLALDNGDFELARGARIGGVAQEVPSNEVSLLNTVLAADTERTGLLAESETATDPNRIAEIHARLTDINAHSAEARAGTILNGLGFNAEAQARPCSDFSGGWRMRVALAAVLFSEPDVLLLDEPTNYLDLEGTIWLESYLARYPHTVVIISHDRQLLNRSVGAILHLDQKSLTLYQGNYDNFVRQRTARREQQMAAKRKVDASRAHMQSFIDRFRAKASKAKQAQSRIKALERIGTVDAVIEDQVSAFNFPSPEPLSPPIVRLEGVNVGYDDKVILRGLDLRIDQDDRIALLGANGQGKSTLSKLLSDRLQPMAGNRHTSSKLRIGYFAQHQVDELDLDETPMQHIHRLRPKELVGKIRARLAAGGLGAEVAESKVGRLSGGQKARLSLLIATIDAPHLIILDEPTNHLDIESREALVMALSEYNGAVILVSHDPHLIECVADRLWLVKDGVVKPYDDDLDAYQRLLLSERGGGADRPKVNDKPKAAPKPPARSKLQPLKAEVTKCEARVTKLEVMRDNIDARLSNQALYDRGDFEEIEKWQKKRKEVMAGLDKAEALWATAVDRLEKAGGTL